MSKKNKGRLKTPNKTADSTPQSNIVQQITVRPYNRTTIDLAGLKSATRSAESLIPRRDVLYDTYHNFTTLDAQIIAVWGKRVDAVTSADWQFTDRDGNPVDEINQLIDCLGFEDLLTAIIDSKGWGYSMAEPRFFVNDNGQNEFSLYRVPPKHMRPETGIIALEQYGDAGINIREGIYAKTIMEFGKADDLGLFLAACFYAILNRGNLSDWAEFIEIFGRGIIDATWDGFDENQRAALAKAFKEMGGGGVIIRPDGTKMEIHNNTGNANGALQATFAGKMDGYISKALLGSTETTDSSKTSGYAQAEIHQEQDKNKNATDLTFVRRNLNSRFIKVLKAAGFDTKGGTFTLKSKKEFTKKEAYEIHKSMAKDLNIPIDDNFFYEEYGMPKPENYKQLKKEALERRNAVLEQKMDDPEADTPPSSKEPKGKTPDKPKVELTESPTFWRRVLRLFQSAPMEVGAITPKCQCGEAHTVRLASFVADKVFEGLKDGLIKRAYAAGGNLAFDAELFSYTAKTLTNGFIQGWRTKPVKLADLGFEYGFDDPNVLTAYEMNLFRFAGVKTLYEAQQLNELFRKSKSFKEFYDTASSMLTVHNRDWLETEFNTAIATGESAATYARLMKQTELFPYWEYKTVGDNKVRHSHQLLDGIILPWNSPLWKYILPPNDWNCRCYIVPRTKAEVTKAKLSESQSRAQTYINSDAFKKAAKGGWGISRVDRGLVFTENQHYANDYLDAQNRLNKLDFENYNLPALKAIFQAQKGGTFKPRYSEDEREQAIESFLNNAEKVSSKKYGIADFGNRSISITKSTIRSHTTDNVDKYADRHIYLELLPEVLKTPNEVWLNSYTGNKQAGQMNNYTYVKYYKGFALTVVARLKDGLGMEIETWYVMQDDGLRKGLLIKN